ncbi:adenosine deaminase [Serratia plymuthica]|uniref:adenosine deaminase n=1 Tax=Serratia plymuthica TaxID=82996 RepID=A0A2X4UKV2_SERPL|nr:adenosine deaminase [Serratia plymuthica]
MIDSRLPLTDIHRHLDGNIRAQTILDLGRQFNLALPADELEALRPHVQITHAEPDLISFLQKLDWGVAVLGDLDACRRVAYENVEDAANAGLHYAELRFSPYYMAMKHQLPVAGVVEAVIDGIRSGVRDRGIDVRLIGIMSRTFGEAACLQELEGLLAHRDGITALDLAGNELGFRAACSSATSTAPATPACALPCTRAKPQARKASGRRSASWVPNVSATG